jgi:hypothetical protein
MPKLPKNMGAICSAACVALVAGVMALNQGPRPAEAGITPTDILNLLSPARKAQRLEATYRKAAVHGEPQAVTDLSCYLFRQRNAAATQEARRLLEQVAMGGNIQAMIYLSKFVYAGAGVTADTIPAPASDDDKVGALQMAQSAFDALRTGGYAMSRTGAMTIDPAAKGVPDMQIQGWLWLITPNCGPAAAGTAMGLAIDDGMTRRVISPEDLQKDDTPNVPSGATLAEMASPEPADTVQQTAQASAE